MFFLIILKVGNYFENQKKISEKFAEELDFLEINSFREFFESYDQPRGLDVRFGGRGG